MAAASAWSIEHLPNEYFKESRLDLSDFDIDVQKLDDIAGLIANHTAASSSQTTSAVDVAGVESLKLGGNRIDGPQAVEHLCTSLLSLDRVRWSLQSLSLDQNDLGNDGVEALASWLAPPRSLLPRLTNLNLHSVGMGPDALPFLARLIANPSAVPITEQDSGAEAEASQFQGLTLLQLDRNRLRDIDQRFCDAIADPACTLQYLSMRRSLLSVESLVTLLHAVAHNQSLHHLNLEEVPITGAAVAALEYALSTDKDNNRGSSLQSLMLSQAKLKLSPDAGRSLGAALSVNDTLTLLDLTSNGLTDAQVVELARGLAVNRGLQRLDLASNAIADEGVQALATALITNSHLRALMLDRNHFTGVGCAALARALESNDSLHTLTINTNSNIGSLGIQALFASLYHNHTLRLLNVSHTAMATECVAALADLLICNSALTSLDVSLNPIGDEGLTQLHRALSVNTTLTSLLACETGTSGTGTANLVDSLILTNSTLETIALSPKPTSQQHLVSRNVHNNSSRQLSLLSLLLSSSE